MKALADLILQTAPSIRRAIEVSADVEIVSYDASTQTASVRPLVNTPTLTTTGEVDGTPYPLVRGAPVRWPSGGGRSLVWGLAAGDRAKAVLRTWSHDEVDSGSDGQVTPASTRHLDWSDAWIEPHDATPADPIPSAGFRSDGQPVFGLPTGEALFVGTSTADKALALAQETAGRIERIEAYLNTATYLTPAGTTTAPAPPPFTGTTSVFPLCTASVVVGSVAATDTAAVQSTRIKVDT